MPKLLLLLSCWLMASASICQRPPAAFFDTPTITATSVGKAAIGMPLIKLKEAYSGCTFSAAYLSNYGFDEYGAKPNATLVSRDGQKLFVFWLNTQTKKVAGLIVLSAAYQTKQGIHVGSTSGQLKKAFPAIRAVPNMLMQEIEMAFVGEVGMPGIEYAFFKQGHLGKYLVADEPANVTAPNAKISWVQVFPNP
jgi:hypothetical protein